MKKIFILILPVYIALVGLQILNNSSQACAQGQPSIFDMTAGIKDALSQGTKKSTVQLSAVNGFFGDAAVKIFFPPEAQQAEKTLRGMGLGKQCDEVILSLNRAAEDAAKEAQPIFFDAIKNMSVDDATKILSGKEDAATEYFKRVTSTQLAAKFKPVIKVSLDKVGATKFYTDFAKAYNKLPFVKHVNPDITEYATQKAIDGIFIEIAKEELNIRKNISARSTPMMQQAFSFAGKLKH